MEPAFSRLHPPLSIRLRISPWKARLHVAKPLVDPATRLLFGQAVTLLNLAFELLAVTAGLLDVVIRQLGPLFTHVALHLLPLTFNLVPVHKCLPPAARVSTAGGSCRGRHASSVVAAPP